MTTPPTPQAIFRVETERGRVLLETDDWVEAETLSCAYFHPGRNQFLHVRGTHPTHDWDGQRPRRCRNCAGWDNGSYGSHAPCGYDFGGLALVTVLERENAAREEDTR